MLSFSSITPTTSNLSSYNYELTIANEMKTSAPKIIQAFILLLDAMSSSLLLIALIKYAGKAMPKTVATIIIISINFISTTPFKNSNLSVFIVSDVDFKNDRLKFN